MKNKVILGNTKDILPGDEIVVLDYDYYSGGAMYSVTVQIQNANRNDKITITNNPRALAREIFENTNDFSDPNDINYGCYYPTWLRILIVMIFAYQLLMPRSETAKYMAGAYIIQAVATNETTKEFGKKFGDVLINQLNIWSTESPKLKELVGNSIPPTGATQTNDQKPSSDSETVSSAKSTSPTLNDAEQVSGAAKNSINKIADNVTDTADHVGKSIKKIQEVIEK
jgi:hypothetical protein